MNSLMPASPFGIYSEIPKHFPLLNEQNDYLFSLYIFQSPHKPIFKRKIRHMHQLSDFIY